MLVMMAEAVLRAAAQLVMANLAEGTLQPDSDAPLAANLSFEIFLFAAFIPIGEGHCIGTDFVTYLYYRIVCLRSVWTLVELNLLLM